MMFGWLLLIIIAIYYFRNQGTGHVHRSDALALLSERYARGEISTEEFNERRQVLKNS